MLRQQIAAKQKRELCGRCGRFRRPTVKDRKWDSWQPFSQSYFAFLRSSCKDSNSALTSAGGELQRVRYTSTMGSRYGRLPTKILSVHGRTRPRQCSFYASSSALKWSRLRSWGRLSASAILRITFASILSRRPRATPWSPTWIEIIAAHRMCLRCVLQTYS